MKELKKLICNAESILISTHIMPDADGIGAQVALYLALKKIGKTVYAVNEDKLHERWIKIYGNITPISFSDFQKNKRECFKKYLKKHSKKHTNKCSTKRSIYNHDRIDLFILVDANSTERIGPNMQKLLTSSNNFICIDHHPSSSSLIEAIHYIDTNAAATAEIIAKLIKSFHIKYTIEMALALYSAIVIDTSSFRYPNVTAYTHKLISELLKTGLNPAKVYDQFYGTKSLKHFRLLGKILENVKITNDQKIAYLTIPQKLLGKYNVDEEDTYSYVNYLLVLDKIKIVCLFRELEKPKGYIKISLRSNFQIKKFDAGEMAKALGGGGHNHSAAAIIKGPLNKVISQTIIKIKEMLKLTT
ncbi:MAG: bifunctional oligoribonuclease/PAP phosphatase NrnA [Oligoflexia bacterium]|nr:bifunctional oligoribonuclease/PAP phosphatase NrnA [Oligoflexia bacterium]